MSYENVKSYRLRLKQRAVYVLGGKCQCCGYDKCIQALDFHHVNPEEKEYNFNENANRSWDHTKEEIKKCLLVCANCHREIHAGFIDSTKLVSSYDEEKAKEIDQQVKDLKTHKLHYCKNCGELLADSRATYCVKCSHIVSRQVERPSREELKNLIRTKAFTSIAKDYKVTDNTIRKWCDAENLPRKKSDINKISDEEWQLL